ncbi:MAG: hypothetical protein IPP60_08880 [Sphingobacteriales bacterium]|nr:hypothetical protein [Sphingobacteriales bacterium]MBP8192494.1 hypothetical protein [Chitinophagales bacterium]HNY55585.1 hypothetical protein [Chitinophagales bacterium]
MQIRGKILTIAGIVLMFGYFIKDSLRDPYDPTQITMVGNDTLGRDWGAMAEQAIKNKALQNSEGDGGLQTETDGEVNTLSKSSDKLNNINSEQEVDPFTKQKFDQNNYSTIISPDGREIITGYNRPEQVEEENEEENSVYRYTTRHQKEVGEPEMKYRD